MVKSAYWEEALYDGWDIAVDGVYDSRGFIVYYCKVLAVDLKTRLCIRTEVVHISETGGISGHMEREGFRQSLRWFADRSLPVRSVTSDRDAHFKTVIDEVNSTLFWDMEWYFDHWHLCRYLVKAIRFEATSVRSIEDMIKRLKAHMKCAAESGSRAGDDNIRSFFNTCLYHIAGIHSWDQDELTGPYISCSHEVMEGGHPDPIPLGSAAHDKLREIVLENRFQKDLSRLSPHGGTSQCETKNALDRLYCPKDVCFLPSTYPGYVALLTLHLDTLRLAEMSGERVEERDKRRIMMRTRLIDLELNQMEDAFDIEERLRYVEGYSDDDVGDVDEGDLDLPSEMRFCSPKE
ncbi:hypothetical protein Aduo_002052 [Ancylostoma duodenale]